MHKPIEYCPNCGSLRELDLSLGMMTINHPAEKEEVFLYHYHCASCNAYVRSTTLDYQEVIRPREYAVNATPQYV